MGQIWRSCQRQKTKSLEILMWSVCLGDSKPCSESCMLARAVETAASYTSSALQRTSLRFPGLKTVRYGKCDQRKEL